MATASNIYVEPFGAGLFNSFWGQPAGKWPDASNITPMFGDDPMLSVRNAWDAKRLGLGVLDAPGQIPAALMESTGRYMGGPNNGSWNERWDQWFGTDVVGPDGNTLLSPLHQTGLRVGQDYGVGRDAQGKVAGPAGGDIYRGFNAARGELANNPWLDPTQANAGYNATMTGSPFATPDVGNYIDTVRGAAGGPGEADFYGQRGLGQVQGLAGGTDFDRFGLEGIQRTNDLATQNLKKLTRNIDTEAQDTLAMKLPEIGAAMQAAGMGRSGAAQQSMLQAQNDILGQANRDKQRTLADFQTQTLNRQADAINLATQQGFQGAGQKFGAIANSMDLGSQLGAQGYENYAGRMGNAALAGLGDEFAMNEANRAGARSLWQQGMDQQNQRYLGDSSNYLNALDAGGRYQLGTMEAERLGQSSALSDYMNLVGQRENWRSSSLNEMLGLADREQSYRQERLNQMLAAGYEPLDIMLRVATGTQAPASGNYARTSPWSQIAPQAIGNFAGGFAGEAGEQVAPWVSGLFGMK